MARHSNKTPRDDEYVAAYLSAHSQIKAAEMCGVSRETIARAVRRAGIVLDGRKHNNGQQNGMMKASDEQIIQDAKTMSCYEIAIKYGMSEERVFRRARKLGIPIVCKFTGGHFRRRAVRYGCKEFDESITIKALMERDGGICQICGLPVDTNDVENGHARRMYPSIDHIIPLSKGGSHTWDNVQLAHLRCNAGKCDRTSEDGVHGKNRKGVRT